MNPNPRSVVFFLFTVALFFATGCWETTNYLCKPGSDDDQPSGEGEGEGEGEDSATQTETETETETESEEDTDALVPEGEVCNSLFGPLGNITGICQKPEDSCAGGFANADPVPPLYPGKEPQFNCQDGLLCCIDTDQCGTMDAGIKSLVPVILLDGSQAQCQPSGGCEEPAYEVSENFACPDGETCCFTTLMPSTRSGVAGGS